MSPITTLQGGISGSTFDPMGSASQFELRTAREARDHGLSIPPSAVPAPAGPALPGREGGEGFLRILQESLDKVNAHQAQADTAIKELVAGRTKNIHETMLAIERADSSLKLMMQVRNKILDAYREIMRMQV